MPSFQNPSSRYIWLLFAIFTSTTACSHHVGIAVVEHSVISRNPSYEPIHPYYQKGPLKGDHLEVVFESPSNIEELAIRYTGHLYYDFRACSSSKMLYSGEVFEVSDRKGDAYAIYIPTSIEKLETRAKGFHDLPVSDELAKAQQVGFCFRIGGAKFPGFPSLFSSYVQIPVRVSDGHLSFSTPPN